MIKKSLHLLFASIAIVTVLASCQKECTCEKEETPTPPAPPAPTEKTISLQPGPNDGNDVYVSWLATDPSWANSNNNSNANTNPELSAVAWTINGDLSITRSYLSFDLTKIPSDAQIVSAKLTLYGIPSSKVSPQGNSGDNKIIIQQVTDNWSEATLTWNTQPTLSATNQLEITPGIGAFNVDLTNIDVTALVKEMRLIPSKTGGFMIKLKNETTFRSLCLASSENSDPTKRPKLEVVYKN